MKKKMVGKSESILALMAYCASSIMMTLMNKYVLSEIPFKMNFFLLACQSFICVIMLRVCKSFGLIKYRNFSLEEARIWYPVSLSLVVMIYTGSKSLQFLAISLFTIFKNVTIILIAFGEKLMFGRLITELMLLSFFLMVMSSVMGGYTDIKFDLVGYLWMALNCACTAGYALFMKKFIAKVEFRDFDTVFYNNVMSFPIFAVFSLLFEDWGIFLSDYSIDGPLASFREKLALGIIFSSFSAFAISYCTAWAIRTTTSTTYSMVGALNKLPVAISGILFLPSEKTISTGNILSVFLAFLAGLVYSYSQISMKKEQQMTLKKESEMESILPISNNRPR